MCSSSLSWTTWPSSRRSLSLCQEKSGVWSLWWAHLCHATPGPQVKSLPISIPTGWIKARISSSCSSKNESSSPTPVADAAEPTGKPETMGRSTGTSSSLLPGRSLASYLRGCWTMPTCCSQSTQAQGRANTTRIGTKRQETSRSTCCSSSCYRRPTSVAHRSSTSSPPTSTSSLPRGVDGPSAIDGSQTTQTVPQVRNECTKLFKTFFPRWHIPVMGDPPPPQHTSGPYHQLEHMDPTFGPNPWHHGPHGPIPHMHRAPHQGGHALEGLAPDPMMDPTGAPLPARDMGAYGGMINFLFPHNHRSMVGLEVRTTLATRVIILSILYLRNTCGCTQKLVAQGLV